MAQHAAALLSTERTNRAAVNGGGPVTYTDAASLGNAGGGSRVGLGGTRVAGNGTTQNNQNGTTTNGHSNGYEKKAGVAAPAQTVTAPPPQLPPSAPPPSNNRTTNALATTTSNQTPNGDDVIVIHVCDDNRRINRDFYCSRELLLTHMAYFTPYLADERRFEDIDISVHCDVHIFEWLMEYIHQPAKPPTLDPGSVISVLISADFLQMRPLADHCIEYLRGALHEVLRLPIDLSCVSDTLLAQLAALLDAEEIERLRDKKDKISSRLYAKKLEALLAEETNTLHRCAFCARLFTSAQREWEPCPRAPPLLDFHGNPIAEHVPNRAWDVQRWVTSLRRAKGGAREAYWRLWGLTHFVTCSTCDIAFPICELDRCAYHPQEPVYERGDHRGHYPCCGQAALRFETGSHGKAKGCMFKRHTPVTRPPFGVASPSMQHGGTEAAKIVEIALAHADLVLSSADPGNETGAFCPPVGGGGGASRIKAAAEAAAAAAAADDDDDIDEEALLGALNGLSRDDHSQHGGSEKAKARPKSAAAAGGSKGLKSAAKRAMSASRNRRGSSNTAGGGLASVAATERDPDSDPDVPSDHDRDSDLSYASDSSASAGGLSYDSDSSDGGRMASALGGQQSAAKGVKDAKAGGKARKPLQLESMMLEDEQAMTAMSAALERLRREQPPPNQPPALLHAKPMFLDRRLIMHIARAGGTGVVWPRTAAAAARRY